MLQSFPSPSLLASLAVLAEDSYAASPSGRVIDARDNIRVVITEHDGDLVVVPRGTVIQSVDNWFIDFDAVPVYHVATGWVPRGFLGVALELIRLIAEPIAGRRVIVAGHSLGGSVAIHLAALLAATGRPPILYAAFEPACTGTETLTAHLASVPGYICHFGNDPVPLLPPLYRHPCPVTAIGRPAFNPIACHSITGVVAWLTKQQMEVPA